MNDFRLWTVYRRLLLVGLSSLLTLKIGLADERAITTQIVDLTTADGLNIAAFVMYPSSGFDPGAPGIVFHHGGFGGHGARKIGAPRSVAERLAEAGYATITLISRHVDGYVHRDVEEARFDIAAAVDYLAEQGIEDLVLAGHSMGSMWVSIYYAQNKDPRVKAMLHFAPTHDMHPLFERMPNYQETLQSAQADVKNGKGGFDGSNIGPLESPPLYATAYGRPQTAEALLSWWGPDATNANSYLFPLLDVPILLLAGTEDPYVPKGRLRQLKKLAANSPRVDFIWYEGGDHYFTDLFDRATADSIEWLETLSLAPNPPIRTRFVDSTQRLTIDAGSAQERSYSMNYPGLLFEPTLAERKTLALILPDWQSDIMHPEPMHIAERFAAHGIPALIPQLRTNNLRGSLDSSFDKTVDDLNAWREVARDEGFDSLIAVTLGRAAFWASAYNERHRGIDALIMLSPPDSLPEYLRDALGDSKYRTLISRAHARQAEESKTDVPMQSVFQTRNVDGSLETHRLLQYPSSLLEYYGPNSKAKLALHLSGSLPITVVAGPSAYYDSEDQLRNILNSTESNARLIWEPSAEQRLAAAIDAALQTANQ